VQIGNDIQASAAAASGQAERLGQLAERLAKQAGGDAETAAAVPRQFSKLLATMLVKEMRRALPEGFFGEGAGSDIFDGWLDEHMGSALADRDGLRIEGMIAHSMQRKLEANAAPGAPPGPGAEGQVQP
jgi:Rod binding domain-containing protein